jgi:hypothetical protein
VSGGRPARSFTAMPAVVTKNMLRVLAALSLFSARSPCPRQRALSRSPRRRRPARRPTRSARFPSPRSPAPTTPAASSSTGTPALTRPTAATPRAEVLLAEASEAPTVWAGCNLTDGEWLSYYDEQEVSDPAKHTSTTWSPSPRRGTPAPPPGAPHGARRTPTTRTPPPVWSRSRRGPTAKRPTRTRAPGCRRPRPPPALSRRWTATKLRWGLTADQSEIDTIEAYAGGPCQMTVVHYIPEP